MTETMTIHRGLSEIKTIEKRIDKEISNADFCYTVKKSDKHHAGRSKEELISSIQSSYDKIVALIARRNAIKSAIISSNAKTTVEVAGTVMTVAEAIERKNSIKYDKDLTVAMETDYLGVTYKNESENVALEERLDKYIESITGSAKDSLSPEELEKHTKTFMDRNSYEIIDPLGVKKIVDEITDFIYEFESEVDSVLSESNAITKIEI